MKPTTFASLLLASLAACSVGSGVKAEWCGVDRSPSLARLETLARDQDSIGVVARSVLDYLAREKHTTSGYFISRGPTARSGNRVSYSLYHESGFGKHCDLRGNRSGLDGVVEVDSATNEVLDFLYTQ